SWYESWVRAAALVQELDFGSELVRELAFSLETCKLMLAMLDQDYSGSMGFEEFKNLSTALNGWKQHFIRIDVDRSGTVEGPELNQALASMGLQRSSVSLFLAGHFMAAQFLLALPLRLLCLSLANGGGSRHPTAC
uniref:grancalcin-like n=1 Tax=Myxine glutinosa TaxID=7769 RepID=UPI00358DEAEB